MKRFAWWGNIVLLSVLTLVLAGPIWGDGVPDAGPPAFTDYGSLLGEYRAAGALKFYDNTEAILRLAQFEYALMRYRFLKGQIQRKGDYHGLLAMVDLRLKFLKKQLHLHEADIAAIPPRKERIPQAKKPEVKPPPEKGAAAKPTLPGAAAKKNNATAGPAGPGQTPVPGQIPPVVVLPSPSQKAGAPPVTATPPVTGVPSVSATPPVTAAPAAIATPPVTAAQKPPDVVTSDAKAKEEKSEEEKEETKPAPPLSFWDKMKIRLHLKKQAAESGS